MTAIKFARQCNATFLSKSDIKGYPPLVTDNPLVNIITIFILLRDKYFN